jgi:hypothetical protein
MATNKYITLAEYIPSSGSPGYSKRFPVVQVISQSKIRK